MVHAQQWMYMFHGNVFLRYNNQDITNKGNRGDTKVDAPNWIMAMGQRSAGDRGLFRFSSMFSLDPLFGGEGYPLLFQTGETYQVFRRSAAAVANGQKWVTWSVTP